MTKTTLRCLFAGTSLVTVAASYSAHAQADNSPNVVADGGIPSTQPTSSKEQQSASSNAAPPSAPAPENVIIVSGYRESLESAIAVKRNADTVVDAISAEDIGKFPDANVSESLQRITGVQINRTRGEGRSVNIRGLPAGFTFATLNGQQIPNAISDGGNVNRQFDFSILPSEFVRVLEVYKEPTADMEEGGLAGTVNLRTPRPFDFQHTVFTATAQADWSSNSGKVGPRLAAFYSTRPGDGRFGIALGVAYSRSRPETHSAVTNYTSQTEGGGIPAGKGPDDLNGDGVIEPNLRVRIPAGIIYSNYKEDRERLSGLASLQFEATDALTFYADGFYSKLNVLSNQAQFLNIFNNATDVVPGGVSVTDLEGLPTATRFQVKNLDLRGNNRLEDRTGDLRNLTVGATWEKSHWTINIEGAIAGSDQNYSELALANIANGSATFLANVGQQIPSVTYQDGFDTGYLDPSAYRVASLNGAFHRKVSSVFKDAKIDITRQFSSGFLKALKVGAKYVDTKVYQNNSKLVVQAAGVSALYGGLPPGPIPGSYSAAPFMVPVTAGRGSYLGAYGGSQPFPSILFIADTQAFLSNYTDEQLIAAGNVTDDPTGITNVRERTLAGYIRGDFESGAFSGNVGLRVVNTRQSSVGVSPDLTGITIDLDAGYVTRVPSSEPVSVARSYTDYLPSLNLKWEASDNLDVRFAVSRTMTRPNLTDIAPTTTANANAQTITQKNPYLEPFRSDNADLAVNWYFAPGAALGGTLFYKKLQSLIRSDTTTQDFPVTFIRTSGNTRGTVEFTVNSLQNGQGVTVKGVEVYYQQTFTFLPGVLSGLGTLLNYTFIDNSDPEQLTAASRHNFNATLYYERGPVQARLSYSWRDGFLANPQAGNNMGVRTEPFGTLDASMTYRLNDALSIVVQGSNLLNSTEKDEFTTGIPNRYFDPGQRLLAGVRIKL